MTYLVVAVLLLHVSVMPIVINASAAVNTDSKRVETVVRLFFIPVFVKRASLPQLVDKIESRADENALDSGKEENPKKKVSGRIKRYLIKLAAAMIRRIRLHGLGVEGVIGTGDAATTAIGAGSIAVTV